GVKFSRHAVDRMNSRGIQFNPNQLQRLETAVSQVAAKGGRESLVILDDTALVVSVKNDTVVTVVDREQLKNNVFTNIDSAVIA
ncbi:MAG: flagellar protein, partial [Desulfuromonadales bacterium]|nr:flagellar protein [Desulfuromonadales bacterium]